jgi:hypothetical protein
MVSFSKVFPSDILIEILARATTEPPQGVDEATGSEWEAKAAKIWSKGWGAAGYSLFTNLTSLLPGTTGYPVHYPVPNIDHVY